ncbi:HAD-like domain-containing protein [Mrakia frigida]|uniref:HAD-like domain-containing protein n=1 Tax=Mrakia frigida TaxID=29902 RepID=UPI003FCBFCBE
MADISSESSSSTAVDAPPPQLPSSAPLPHVSDPDLVEAGGGEKVVELKMSWSGKTFNLSVPDQDRVYDLKILIWSLTSVPIDRVKLIGLTSSRNPPEENAVIASLNLKSGKKFMMLGTSVENSFKDPTRLQQAEVVDDLDVDYTQAKIPPHLEPRNIRKIKETTAGMQLDLINPPRPGKKLLVLDLDYTIVDTKPLIDGSLPSSECARPALHEFLELVYPHYDLVIWSQTSWRWLESKLVELGMLGDESRNYKISFVVDRRPMFTIFTEREGQPYKRLQLLWNKFPQFSAANTVHIDDLSRNFALNPREGLKIKAFKGAGTNAAAADRELVKLGAYLIRLAGLGDFREMDHGKDWPKWRKQT